MRLGLAVAGNPERVEGCRRVGIRMCHLDAALERVASEYGGDRDRQRVVLTGGQLHSSEAPDSGQFGTAQNAQHGYHGVAQFESVRRGKPGKQDAFPDQARTAGFAQAVAQRGKKTAGIGCSEIGGGAWGERGWWAGVGGGVQRALRHNTRNE